MADMADMADRVGNRNQDPGGQAVALSVDVAAPSFASAQRSAAFMDGGARIARGVRRKANANANGQSALNVPPMAYGLSSYNMAPALKALSLSPIADTFAAGAAGSGGLSAQVGGDLADHAPVQRSAAAAAEAGFAGGGHEIPHRKAMEASFGMDFGHVRAHTGGSAEAANTALNSHAYAMGDQVAFKSQSPDQALVAHELTHVIQHANNPSFKSDSRGIDTSGEHEAEAVESAVRAGKPAKTALKSAVTGGKGPALRKRGPALEGDGPKFGMGMSFSLEGFEKSYSYTIWKGHYATPTPVPGVNFVVDPNVKVTGKGNVKYGGEEKGNLSASLGVFGECGLGLSGGIPDVAEVYGTINPSLEGAFTLTKIADHAGGEHGGGEHGGGGEQGGGEHAGGGQQAAGAGKPASTWSLVGSIALKAAAKIGVSLAGGILDQAFELGNIDIATLTGVYFDQTGFRTDKLGFEWGPKIKEAFTWIKAAIDKAKNMGKAAIQAAKDAGGAVVQGAKDMASWVTSW